MKFICVFFALLVGSIALANPMPSDLIGTVPLQLRFNNVGATSFGFKDGYVPTLFKVEGKVNVPTFLDLPKQTVTVRATSAPTVFRVTFEKPIILNLANIESGEQVSQHPLRHLDIDAGKQAEELIRLLSVPRNKTVFTIHENDEKKIASFWERLNKEGPEPFVEDTALLPELFALKYISATVSLGDLQRIIARPVPVISMMASYNRVDTPNGGISDAGTSIGGSIKTYGSAPLQEEWVQNLLSATYQIRVAFKKKWDQALIDAGIYKDLRPDAKVIKLPAKPKTPGCKDPLNEE